MATLPTPFNPQEVEPSGGPQNFPVSGPEGHLVRITDSQWLPVKDNPQLGRLVFTLEILEGQHAGFKGSYGLNLGHDNPQVVEISRGELSALCHVLGVFSLLHETSVLHGKPFRACVRQQKKSPEYTEVHKVLDQYGRAAREVKAAGPYSVGHTAAAPTPAVAPAAAPAPAPAPAPVPGPAFAPPAMAPVAAPPMQAPPAPAQAPQAPAVAPPAAPVGAPPSAPAAAPVVAPPPAAAPAAPGAGTVPPWEQPQQ